MTDVKASIEWARQQAHIWRQRGDQAGSAYMVRHYTTLADAAAEPRLPKEPSDAIIDAMVEGAGLSYAGNREQWLRIYGGMYRALWAHLARPHVDFDAVDEARMDDSSDAGPSEAIKWVRKHHGRGSKAAGGKSQSVHSEPHNCTPAARDELRAAISVLRGWSAEAAGRTGLQPAVRMVCNAAEATLPVQFYRIRAKGLDVVHAGPVSISEIEQPD